MKRLHIHVAVDDLAHPIRFYNALFAVEPTVSKSDYAKWMLDDPRVNFAISKRGANSGLQHLGIQVETENELSEVYERLQHAGRPVIEEGETTCCYADSAKILDHRSAGAVVGDVSHLGRKHGLWRRSGAGRRAGAGVALLHAEDAARRMSPA